MATKDDVQTVLNLTLLERLHMQKGIALYIKSMERSRNCELPGSDVYGMRTRDLAILRDLAARLS